MLLVPPDLPAAPVPLLVLLHGAGSSGRAALALVAGGPPPAAVVLAPDSRERTWDALLGGFGPDVAFLDAALEHVVARATIDPARVVLAGFSDGASYALGLGLANGDLTRRVVAFSPGFVPPVAPAGRPAVLVAHGISDRVLPIDRCSRRLVPALRAAGYDVTYEEFDGGHVVPPELAGRALDWALG